MTTDPKDAEVARLRQQWEDHDAAWSERVAVLTAALAETNRSAIAKIAEATEARMRAEAERGAALALVAGAYEAAAEKCDRAAASEVGRERAYLIAHAAWFRALTPADALAALSRRDTQMRAEGRKEGMREAAAIAYRVCAETRHVTLGQEAERAILAAAGREAE